MGTCVEKKPSKLKGKIPRGGSGRPFITPELEEEILERLGQGESLLRVCRDEHMPDEAAVRKKALKDEAFGPKYVHAREVGYHRMADEMLEIADATDKDNVNVARLRCDKRQWLLSKCLPKIYGDKPLELTGKDGGPIVWKWENPDDA